MSTPTARIPLIDEAGSRMDWPHAVYRTEIQIGTGSATVTNTLDGADELKSLVADGIAMWAVEFRCPRSLMGWTHTSLDPTFSVSWEPTSVVSRVFLRPGLVTVGKVTLPPSGLHKGIWTGPVQIPAGSWLAQGRMYASESLSSSLLRWIRDEQLPPGQMRVVPDLGSGEIVFMVHLAIDLFNRLQQSRDVQVAALIAACSHLPRLWSDAEDSDDGLYGLLRERFRQGGMDWEDDEPETFDPARAATILEQFEAPPEEDEGEE